MNIIELVKDEFSYLTKNEFKFSKKEKNSELEIFFQKNKLGIELYIDSYSEKLDIVISKGMHRINLLDFGFVNKEAIFQITKNMGLAYKLELFSKLIEKHFTDIENLGV